MEISRYGDCNSLHHQINSLYLLPFLDDPINWSSMALIWSVADILTKKDGLKI